MGDNGEGGAGGVARRGPGVRNVGGAGAGTGRGWVVCGQGPARGEGCGMGGAVRRWWETTRWLVLACCFYFSHLDWFHIPVLAFQASVLLST